MSNYGDDGRSDPAQAAREARAAARRTAALAEARANRNVTEARLREVEAISLGRVAEAWIDGATGTYWIYTFQNGGVYIEIPRDLTSRPGEAHEVSEEELDELLVTASATSGTEDWIRCRRQRNHQDGLRLMIYTFDGIAAYEPEYPPGQEV